MACSVRSAYRSYSPLNQRFQTLGLAVAAVHTSRVDRQRESRIDRPREVRRGVAHLCHDVGRPLAECEQKRGKGAPERVRRQTLRQWLDLIRNKTYTQLDTQINTLDPGA